MYIRKGVELTVVVAIVVVAVASSTNGALSTSS